MNVYMLYIIYLIDAEKNNWDVMFNVITQSNSDKCISNRFEMGLSTTVLSETILSHIIEDSIPDVFIVGTNETYIFLVIN